MEPGLQTLYFQHIRGLIPPHMSLVDEVAELLHISNDSAYRRIRGEKPIGLEEVRILCTHFRVSMDQLLNLKSDAFIFTGNLKGPETSFEDWLNNVLQQFQWLASLEKNIFTS